MFGSTANDQHFKPVSASFFGGAKLNSKPKEQINVESMD